MFVPVICALMIACEKPTPATVNKDEAEKSVTKLFEDYAKAFAAIDVNALGSMFAEDGLFLGTDPTEFWTKSQVLDQFTAMAKDTTLSLQYDVEKRDIRLSEDGMTAIVTAQSIIPMISNKISVRSVAHSRMTDGQWKIDYVSWALVPKNDDMEKLNKAMEE